MNGCDIFEKFAAARGELLGTDHWRVVTRPKQITAGALVLIARRHVGGIAELTAAEAADLPSACAALESRLRAAFQPDKINYLALMMVDPHLHFHVVPRYQTTRTIAGYTFCDPAWGGPPKFDAECPGDDVVAAVHHRLRG